MSAHERPAPLHPQGQVVDVAPGNNRVPDESKYLAETNNRVKKETRAREQTNRWSRATPKNQPDPTAMPSARGLTQPQRLHEAVLAPDLLTSMLGRRPMSLLSDHSSPGAEEAHESDVTGPVGTEQGTQASGGDVSEGGGAPNDELNDVAQGDGTYLNTREWKYAGFFNRVKQAVSAKWDPNGRLRARNKELGYDRVTLLHVALRPDGSLADCYVVRSSGLDELDVEAMHAFEAAQPFANPPQALVEKGFIRINFGFSVTNGSLAGMPRLPGGR